MEETKRRRYHLFSLEVPALKKGYHFVTLVALSFQVAADQIITELNPEKNYFATYSFLSPQGFEFEFFDHTDRVECSPQPLQDQLSRVK